MQYIHEKLTEEKEYLIESKKHKISMEKYRWKINTNKVLKTMSKRYREANPTLKKTNISYNFIILPSAHCSRMTSGVSCCAKVASSIRAAGIYFKRVQCGGHLSVENHREYFTYKKSHNIRNER